MRFLIFAIISFYILNPTFCQQNFFFESAPVDVEIAPPATLLLDQYPGAAAAYSLRLLNSSYTGNCIEVRRASNNGIQNIGFAGGVLDTVALKTFCAGTDCFVRTWFDQSLNARDATQTTNANQPLIVSSGIVNRFNGYIAVFIADVTATAQTQRLEVPLWHASTDTHVWAFSVSASPSGTDDQYSAVLGATPIDRGFLILNGVITYTPLRTFTVRSSVSTAASIAATAGTTYLRVDNANQTNINIWANNVAGTSVADSNTNFNMPTTYWMGNSAANIIRSRMHISEMILYNTDQSSNRTGIQVNINNFYSIY
jgi:hypothetical protein